MASEEKDMASRSQPCADAEEALAPVAEPSAAFTPGPWELHQPDAWPWPLIVHAPTGREILQIDRVAHSTKQSTLAECRAGLGFKPRSKREEVVAAIAQQEADARLIAAAPELLDSLRGLVVAWREFQAGDGNHADAYYACVKGMYGAWEAAEAVIAKAEVTRGATAPEGATPAELGPGMNKAKAQGASSNG